MPYEEIWKTQKSGNTTLHQLECSTVSTNVDTTVLIGSSNYTKKDIMY